MELTYIRLTRGAGCSILKCVDDKNETAEISMSSGALHQEMGQDGLMFSASSDILDDIRTKSGYYDVY